MSFRFLINPRAGENEGEAEAVISDPIKYLKSAKNAPRPVLLTSIAIAIVEAIIRHQNAVIVLSLIGILALIVISLILGSLRRH